MRFPILLLVALFFLILGANSEARANVQAHSMLHTFSATPEKINQTFRSAKRMGATRVRLDVEVQGITDGQGNYDYSKLDTVLAASRRYDVKVLGILSGTPYPLSACPGSPDSWKCAATDPAEYGATVAHIIDHAPRMDWEFWNEPDLAYMYTGTPEEYGQMLGAIYREVKSEHPNTRISLGGMAGSKSFIRRAIAAGARFDIANVHLRGRTGILRGVTMRWRRFFKAETGHKLPLWVTEHGFPSDPAFQWDGYRGKIGQARYLRHSVRTIERAGARQVFVTMFDSGEFGTSVYATEGIVGKPAMAAMARLNRLH